MHVQAVKEGSLTVESRGGAVHVGSMGGATAELLTAGAHALWAPAAPDSETTAMLL